MGTRTSGVPRGELIADAALAVLAERGMRGLTHRGVDAVAGLPLGSTSNHARTRLALLEAAVRRLAVREFRILGQHGLPGPLCDRAALAEALAGALHAYMGKHRELLIARYELALEATRRPELRAVYDAAGREFSSPVEDLLRRIGSPAPERHTLSLIAWCDGLMFSCVASSFHTVTPSLGELRTSLRELLDGLLGATEHSH